MEAHDEDWFHEQYIEIVSLNWDIDKWYEYAKLIRSHHYSVIWKADGSSGAVFTSLWQNNWTLVEEVRLSGEATSIESHPYDR